MNTVDVRVLAELAAALAEHMTRQALPAPLSAEVSTTGYGDPRAVEVRLDDRAEFAAVAGMLAVWAESLDAMTSLSVWVGSTGSGRVHLDLTGRLAGPAGPIQVKVWAAVALADALVALPFVDKPVTLEQLRGWTAVQPGAGNLTEVA